MVLGSELYSVRIPVRAVGFVRDGEFVLLKCKRPVRDENPCLGTGSVPPLESTVLFENDMVVALRLTIKLPPSSE